MQREPILFKGGIVAFVTALLNLIVAFGVPLTEEQTAAILQMSGVISPVVVMFVTWWWARVDTTPLADPRDATDEPLVRADDGAPPVRYR